MITELAHTRSVCVDPDGAAWPNALRTIASPPKQLHLLGDAGVLARPCVAIVGTRRPTAYGERIARELATAIARAGACIVSGLALGIDSVAHRAALECGGTTAAVLGAGIDEIYPPSNRRLYRLVAEHGVVLSEFPPGHRSFPGCFPRRNRIIAGLATLTIVIEAGDKSGALITASYALDFDRKVAAVPGPIDSPQSAGANQLLRDGAHVIASVDDAVSLAGLLSTNAADATTISVGSDEAAVWDVVAREPISTDDLIASTGLDASRCLVAITTLEIQGLVECAASGEIRRR